MGVGPESLSSTRRGHKGSRRGDSSSRDREGLWVREHGVGLVVMWGRDVGSRELPCKDVT